MKKLFMLSACVSMLFAACSVNEEQPLNPTNNDQLLYASLEEQGRTYVEEDTYLRWHEDDRLTAFYGNTMNRQYKFNGKTGDNSGSFSHVPSGDMETGNAFDRIYALYPYDETATITEEGVISLTLPAEQQYAENSFGKGANTMIAVTENREDTFLSFKNACGYLKLKLYAPEGGIVKSIEVKGNDNEKIAGAATATIAFGEAPVVTMADDATTSITLDCGEGVSLGTAAETATEFWMVIPEITFTSGITVTVTDSFGATFTKSTDKEIVIERNTIQPMAAVGFDMLYEVGDLVTYGGAQGIVFYVDDTIIKLVSVSGASKVTWGQYGHKTGATNSDDGRINHQKVNYTSSSNAFGWCLKYGDGWYLPALNEWKALYKAQKIVDEALSTYNYTPLSTAGTYWTSTERDAYQAFDFAINQNWGAMRDKNYTSNVRAIATINK